MPPEGEVLPPFLRGESWVLETPLESLPGPPEGVLSPPDPSWIPAGASGGSSAVTTTTYTNGETIGLRGVLVQWSHP